MEGAVWPDQLFGNFQGQPNPSAQNDSAVEVAKTDLLR